MKSLAFFSFVLIASGAISVHGLPIITENAVSVVRAPKDGDLLIRYSSFDRDVEFASHDDVDLYDRDTKFEDLHVRVPLTATAQTALNWMANAQNRAILNSKPICFYSGSSAGIGAYVVINAFKKSHNCNVIQDILRKVNVNSAGWTTADWMAVSGALAEHSTGTVSVLLGTLVAGDSVWLMAEKKALLVNPAVTKILAYDLAITQAANLKG